MEVHDPRLHAVRPDLADARLRGKVEARRYVAGEAWHVAAGQLSLRVRPAAEAEQCSELLFGETVRVFETAKGWAWLQNGTDGYVGYAKAGGLASGAAAPTHRVSALRTYLYSAPNLKSPVTGMLSMNAAVTAKDAGDGGFTGLAGGGWVWSGDLAPVGAFESDHGAVALRFVGTPYLWGGRSSLGLDCSALVQMALMRCGIDAPRDSDMQAESVGAPVPFDDDSAVLRHGDLVFWPGHVGIWLDDRQFVHANATHMRTVVEPFAAAVERIGAGGDAVTAVRRP